MPERKCSKKKCPVGKIYNPETGRCINIKKSKKVGSRKSKCSEKKCPVGKICNPETGRCINIKKSKKVGSRKSINYKIDQTQEGVRAPIEKEMNIDITGIVNRSLQLPEGSDIYKYLQDKYIIIATNGSVYLFRTPEDEERLLTLDILIYSDYKYFFNTIRKIFIQEIFYRMNLSPKIYSSDLIIIDQGFKEPQQYVTIEMEKINGNLEYLLNSRTFEPDVIENIMREILIMVSIYHQNNYIHGNLEWKNIGYKYVEENKIRLYLINHRVSCCVTKDLVRENQDFSLLEIINLIRNTEYLSKNVVEVRKWLVIIYSKLIQEIKQQDRTRQFIGLEQLKSMVDNIDTVIDMRNYKLYEDLINKIFKEVYERYLTIDTNKVYENLKQRQILDLNIPKNIKKYKPGIITLSN